MAKQNLGTVDVVTSIGEDDHILIETGGSIRRVSASSITVPYVESEVAYGIRRNVSDSSPTCERIGNMDLHRTLPVQSMMRGCLLDDDGNVTQWLPDSSWEGATLDGSKGQVMVRLPLHYRKCQLLDDGTMEVWLSLYHLPDYEEIPEMYVSAYEATVQRSTNKLSSVKSMDADYRGGNNNADRDGTYQTQLGMAATNISGVNFLAYARNRGSNWCNYLYEAHKAITWFYVVEYTTLNSQADYNAELTSEGYHQGGLGTGVTGVNSTYWTNFNNQYPFVPIGYTDSLGNHTGVVEFTMPDEYEASLTLYVPRYRGIENPFAHINKYVCDILCIAHPSEENGGSGLNDFYVCKDISKLSQSSIEDYEFIGTTFGNAAGSGWQYACEVLFGAQGEIIGSKEGGSTSTFFCDGISHNNNITGDTLRALRFGSSAGNGSSVGLFCFYSAYAPSLASSTYGSRLCFKRAA